MVWREGVEGQGQGEGVDAETTRGQKFSGAFSSRLILCLALFFSRTKGSLFFC